MTLTLDWFHKGQRCYYCGIELTRNNPKKGEQQNPTGITHDHLTPKCRGGEKTGGGNIVYACRQCNEDKHHLTLEEYRLVVAFRRGLVSRDAALGMRFWAELRP